MLNFRSILVIGGVLLLTTSISNAEINASPGYYQNGSGKLLQGRFGNCFRDNNWEPKHAIAECEPANLVDTDQDGIANNIDICPNNKPGVQVDARGCELDSDKDGLANSMDTCPNTPSNAKVDAMGCKIAEIDTDGDGIADSGDSCPSSTAGVTVNEKGCESDSDGDRIADSKDLCANTTAGVTVNATGCELDSDGDGIADSKDQCSNTATGYKIDANGCNFIEKLALKSVNFSANSIELEDDSASMLEKVAETLKRHPDMVIEIAGYTDTSGSQELNQALSEKRAASVVEILISKGVPATSFQAKGYGTESPIADNATTEGRIQNRRVELHVIQQPRTQEFQFVLEP